MTTVTYLYDIEGWALHDIGLWMQERFATEGIEVRCVDAARWHAAPEPTDVIYPSYTGLVVPGFNYRRWAGRVITTVHDPCEISHFQDRSSWQRWPLRPLPIDTVDALSAISAELVEVIAGRYGYPVLRTRTWPSQAARIRAKGQSREPVGAIRLFASTNADAYFSRSVTRARLRRIGAFTRGHDGRLDLRQIAAVAVRRHRKNIPLLRRVARFARSLPGTSTQVTAGEGAALPRVDYEAALDRCTVYLCTSTMEGGPLPVMEAVLAGAAVLSTGVGQVAEWVEHGRTGFICDGFPDFRRALSAYARDQGLLVNHQHAAMEVAAARRAPDIGPWMDFVLGR